MRKLKIDHSSDGEKWPITSQQITVWMGEMIRLTEESGTDEVIIIESIVIAMGLHFAKKREVRNRERLRDAAAP